MSATGQRTAGRDDQLQDQTIDLSSVFRPRSIAIVGASERVNHLVTLNNNLHEFKFDGEIYPINPSRETIWGLPCYKDIASAPAVPEMAYIAVNNEKVMNLVEQCAAAGVRSLIVNSNGYADHPDPSGRASQTQLATFVRDHNMLLVGPNCLGVFNVRDHVAAFGSVIIPPLPGSLAIVSHSGSITISLMQAAYSRHIGISHVVSAGNEAVLNVCDYLEYLLADAAANVFCLFIETIREPERFIRLAMKAAELNKPIIMVKIGKSDAARGAAIAHTGSFAGPDAFVDALACRAGVIRASGLDDAMDKCILFGQLPPGRWPRGPRIGVFTVGGGIAGVTADIAASRGLVLPPLDASLASDLRAVYPEKLTIQNPIDTPPSVAGTEDRLGMSTDVTSMFVKGCLGSPNFDAVVVALRIDDPRESSAYFGALDEAVSDCGKPVIFAYPVIKELTDSWHDFMAHSKVAVTMGLDRCAVAMQAAALFHASRRQLDRVTYGGRRSLPEELRQAIMEEIAAGKQVASHAITYALLERFGIPLVQQSLVHGSDTAVEFARKVGYPVVVKLPNSDGRTHKTELGAVHLNLRSDDEVVAAIEGLGGLTTDEDGEGIVVQEMISEALEFYIGASNQGHGYPPAVLAGIGGIFLEATRDVCMRLTPVDMSEAHRMLSSLPGYEIMNGFRGRPKADVAALAMSITLVSELALALRPFFVDMDINPVMVRADGGGVRVVDALITYRQVRDVD